MADVAGDALGAALQQPAGDDAGTDAGGHLDEHEVLAVRPGEGALAEGHDVDVVVDEDRHLEVLLHPAGHVEAIPAGHDRRVHRAPGRVLDGAGNADADRDEVVVRAPQLVEQVSGRGHHPAEHGLGAARDVDGLVHLAEHGAGQVGYGERGVRCAEVGGQYDAGRGVEGELG